MLLISSNMSPSAVVVIVRSAATVSDSYDNMLYEFQERNDNVVVQ